MKTILTKLQRLIMAYIAIVIMTGCTSNDEPAPSESNCEQAVLVYMVANNNLSSWAAKDFNEMIEGMASTPSQISGKLLVYYAPVSSYPELREVMRDGTYQTLITYTDGESSVAESRMRRVVSDAVAYAKAKSYGLVLWSHGTGWLHDYGTIEEDKSKSVGAGDMSTYSFGSDGSPAKKMSIESLNRAISAVDWAYIYFDCCHMATVEVAYELRNRTPQIVACATELGLEGMPYELNVAPLLSANSFLENALDNTFDFYDKQYLAGYGYGCSISLIHTAALEELASLTREALVRFEANAEGYQGIPYFRWTVMSTGIYDMRHYIETICTDESLLTSWIAAFDATVAKHRTTDKVYTLPADDFHGLGCQIITTASEADIYNYKATSWWKDVVSYAFAD